MPANKHKHALPDGSIATRVSANHVYSFVTVARWKDAAGETVYGVASWHKRHPGRAQLRYAAADVTGSVEAVNGGERA